MSSTRTYIRVQIAPMYYNTHIMEDARFSIYTCVTYHGMCEYIESMRKRKNGTLPN